MSESGQLNTGGYGGRYFEFNWWINWKDGNSNQCNIGWNLIARSGGATWYYTKNIKVKIDGNEVFYAGSGTTRCYKNSTFGSGNITLYGASNKSFSVEISGDIYTYGTNNAYAWGSWTLPTIVPPAVPPTPPNSVTVTGGKNGYLDIANPVCNVSWSGATRGTYTITTYNIDTTKNNFASINTPYSANANNATNGSASNVSFASLGLSGGETVRLRVAMMTTQGSWMLTNWGGSFKIVSHPTAPTVTAPARCEIDTNFTVKWSGAKAGTLGIAGYDLEVRGFNGSTWSSWYRIFTCKNQTSYSAGTPKNFKVNGVNYFSSYGKNARFQFRVRTNDNVLTTSSWENSGEVRIIINQPSVPR